ncbi:hypothetical protein ACVJMZ_000994 [Sinorhizobium medicae]
MHRKNVAVEEAVIACLDHHAFHALAVRVRTEGHERVAPAETALGMSEEADRRIYDDVFLANVNLRPTLRPASGQKEPEWILMRFRLTHDTVKIEAAAVEQALELGQNLLARLHLFQKRQKLYEQRDIHRAPSNQKRATQPLQAR